MDIKEFGERGTENGEIHTVPVKRGKKSQDGHCIWEKKTGDTVQFVYQLL